MKEDILEQLVDEYLMHKGYFTMHNVKFKPRKDHPDFVTRKDAVASDRRSCNRPAAGPVRKR